MAFERATVLLLTLSIFAPFYFSLVTVCCVALMTMINSRIREKAFRAPYTKLIFVFLFIWFFVAATYNNYMGMAYTILIYAIFTAGLYLRSVMTRPLFHESLDAACVGSLWCAAIAVLQKLTMMGAAPNYRPVSVFTNANYYGMMIEFTVIIALYRIFTNPRRTPFYAVVMGANFVGLYLTGSCSSLIAMLSAVFVVLLYQNNRKLMAGFFFAVGVGAAVGILFPAVLPRSSDALETTLSQRMSIWVTALRGIRQHPIFGRGAMAYQMIYDRFGGYKTYHSHNLLLDMLLNFGVVGTSAVCAYIFLQLRLLRARFRCFKCGEMNVLILAALTAIFVHGMTDVTILWIQTALLFFLLVSSLGIGSAYTEEISLAELLPAYGGSRSALAAYLKD